MLISQFTRLDTILQMHVENARELRFWTSLIYTYHPLCLSRKLLSVCDTLFIVPKDFFWDNRIDGVPAVGNNGKPEIDFDGKLIEVCHPLTHVVVPQSSFGNAVNHGM